VVRRSIADYLGRNGEAVTLNSMGCLIRVVSANGATDTSLGR